MRTNNCKFFLDITMRCAEQTTCLRRDFGAVIVDERGTIVSTGYNGSPKGMKHCLTCWREDNNIPSGQSYEKCRSVHAEQNALIQAGKKSRGATMFLAGIDVKTCEEVFIQPCFLCAKMIVNAEIKNVVMKSGNTIISMFPEQIYSDREYEAFNV